MSDRPPLRKLVVRSITASGDNSYRLVMDDLDGGSIDVECDLGRLDDTETFNTTPDLGRIWFGGAASLRSVFAAVLAMHRSRLLTRGEPA